MNTSFSEINSCVFSLSGIVRGISVGFSSSTGVGIRSDESSERMPTPVEDEKPTLIPLTIPEREKTQEFISEKDVFMKSIEESLRLNAKIPNTSHCTIPEMKVDLA